MAAPKNILVAGASGLIGQALVSRLQVQHRLWVLGRDKAKLARLFPGTQPMSWEELTPQALNPMHVVVNLAGENIGQSRWTAFRQRVILDSRLNATSAIARACAAADNKSIRLLNASAVGVYGGVPVSHRVFDETYQLPAAPSDFLSTVGLAWEAACEPALQANIAVTKLRFGVVLSKQGGALPKMLPAFQFGLGGRIGSGEQSFPFVTLHDAVKAVEWLIAHPEIVGPVNIVAPSQVSQGEFARALGRVLNRPTVCPLPAFAVRLLFGDMGQELLLHGTAAHPKTLLDNGFTFDHPNIVQALHACVRGGI